LPRNDGFFLLQIFSFPTFRLFQDSDLKTAGDLAPEIKFYQKSPVLVKVNVFNNLKNKFPGIGCFEKSE